MAKGRFTLYITFPFRRGTSPFSKIFARVFEPGREGKETPVGGGD